MPKTLDIVGAKIIGARLMTRAELKEIGWDEDHMGRPSVLEFDKGFVLVASQDEECNGSGELFALAKDGFFHVHARKS